MANTPICCECHNLGNGCSCNSNATPVLPCPRYEAHSHWLARQLATIRREEAKARAVLALGVLTIVFPLAAWAVLNDPDSLRAQQRPATKVLTASASGPMTSTR